MDENVTVQPNGRQQWSSPEKRGQNGGAECETKQKRKTKEIWLK
ncbi:hypothetical protein A2U01_0054352, partial [Trifolium medium]|nr:hypothetical protein [Trifolium medium]